MSTFVPSGKTIDRKWYVVDASGQTLGRLATKAASVLSGKLNPKYVPYLDMGDHVIVINAEKVRLTGLKSQKKVYRRYTGFPGGLREESFTRLLTRKPEKILEEAIKGMLPKSKMGRADGDQVEGVSRRQASPPGAVAGDARSGVKAAISRQLSALDCWSKRLDANEIDFEQEQAESRRSLTAES